jgi:hypothetical protein
MRFLLLASALLLGGCGLINAVQTGTSTVPTQDMTALAKSAYTAKATYDGLLVLAVAYNSRPRCGTPNAPITCSDQVVVDQLRKASAAADAGTQAAENAVRTLGTNPMVASAAVTAANQSVTALKTITDLYSPKVN